MVGGMSSGARANYLAGEWRPARRGATFRDAGISEVAWPQSNGEDVAEAWRVARAAASGWARAPQRRREECLRAMARELEGDAELLEHLGERFGLEAADLSEHLAGLERDCGALFERPSLAGGGIVWWAPD